jgi:hypothetical protein
VRDGCENRELICQDCWWGYEEKDENGGGKTQKIVFSFLEQTKYVNWKCLKETRFIFIKHKISTTRRKYNRVTGILSKQSESIRGNCLCSAGIDKYFMHFKHIYTFQCRGLKHLQSTINESIQVSKGLRQRRLSSVTLGKPNINIRTATVSLLPPAREHPWIRQIRSSYTCISMTIFWYVMPCSVVDIYRLPPFIWNLYVKFLHKILI